MLNPENLVELDTRTSLDKDELIKLLIAEVDRLGEVLRSGMDTGLVAIRTQRDAYTEYVNVRSVVEASLDEYENKEG